MAQKIFNICMNNGSYCAMNIINKAFTELVSNSEKCTYSLDEYEETMPLFIEDMIEYVKAQLLCTTELAKNLLYEIGITDNISKTVEHIKSAIVSMPNKIKAIFASTDTLKTQSISKTKKILNECLSHGIIVTEIDPAMDLSAYSDTEKYRIYACRTKYGTQEVKFYVVENPVNSDLNSRAVKATYTIDTDENYFQTRPILYENWLKLDSYHQMQTV